MSAISLTQQGMQQQLALQDRGDFPLVSHNPRLKEAADLVSQLEHTSKIAGSLIGAIVALSSIALFAKTMYSSRNIADFNRAAAAAAKIHGPLARFIATVESNLVFNIAVLSAGIAPLTGFSSGFGAYKLVQYLALSQLTDQNSAKAKQYLELREKLLSQHRYLGEGTIAFSKDDAETAQVRWLTEGMKLLDRNSYPKMKDSDFKLLGEAGVNQDSLKQWHQFERKLSHFEQKIKDIRQQISTAGLSEQERENAIKALAGARLAHMLVLSREYLSLKPDRILS